MFWVQLLILVAITLEVNLKLYPPLSSTEFIFQNFQDEPISWKFDISTDSDAFIVTWELYSTWIEGDPPNPPSH